MPDLVLEYHKDTCSLQALPWLKRRIRTWKTLETIKRCITTTLTHFLSHVLLSARTI